MNWGGSIPGCALKRASAKNREQICTVDTYTMFIARLGDSRYSEFFLSRVEIFIHEVVPCTAVTDNIFVFQDLSDNVQLYCTLFLLHELLYVLENIS